MQKLIISLCIICSLALPSISMGADYMVGVRAGYFAWQPFLKDIGASGMNDISWGTGMLYGPIFSIMVTDDLSLSVSALFGKQSTHWQSEFSYFNSTTRVTGNYQFEAFRGDVDSAISYRISQYIKIFAGYKYQYLALEYKYTEIRTDLSNAIDEIDVATADPTKNHFHGPALGIGFTYPITEVYFFSTNISGLYMTGDLEFKSKGYELSGTNLTPKQGGTLTVPIRQLGVNIEPVIGMNPGNNLPIITVGFRFQQSRLQITDSRIADPDKWYDDTIIGGFVSAVVMF